MGKTQLHATKILSQRLQAVSALTAVGVQEGKSLGLLETQDIRPQPLKVFKQPTICFSDSRSVHRAKASAEPADVEGDEADPSVACTVPCRRPGRYLCRRHGCHAPQRWASDPNLPPLSQPGPRKSRPLPGGECRQQCGGRHVETSAGEAAAQASAQKCAA
mmetsp:Transcript_97838/g.292257  ORF Transcript_97838/g.292257 Transcript_97838/m.292257 type:complete len:161 (-) Transcript_97838:8-490(-)